MAQRLESGRIPDVTFRVLRDRRLRERLRDAAALPARAQAGAGSGPARLLTDALVSGTLAGLASAATASLAGTAQGHAPAAVLNAVSHVLWGERAAREDAASGRYTVAGFMINHAASVFWATCYEALRRRAGPGAGGALASAAATAALAYVVDYHLVPRRLTPGYELRLRGPALALVYAAIALSLPLRELTRRRR